MKRAERKPLSLAARVMVFAGMAIGLSLILLGALVLDAVEHHFSEQDAGELVVMTDALVTTLRNADADADADADQLRQALSNAISGHHGVYFQVRDRQDGILYTSPGAGLSQASTSLTPVSEIRGRTLQTWSADGTTFRGALARKEIDGHAYLITTAIDIGFHLRFLRRFRYTLWSIMSLTGVVTLLAAWYGVHQAHAPLRRLSDRMEYVKADRLHVRLDPLSVPSELRGVVTSFNHMIGRLEDSFARLSHFSADIAHELRTPLTNLITQTQVGLGRARSPEAYRELLYSSLEEQERLATMVNDMLWLAKSDHGLLEPAQEPLNPKHEVEELFDFFGALAEDRGIRLSVEGEAPIIRADRAMLRRAISNLLSNAIRHTCAGGTVLVQLAGTGDGEMRLSVRNPGPGIAAEHLHNIFDRFYRVDPSRTRKGEGAGLGLAIVRSIVELHGGRVEATSTRNDTTFKLVFPAARNHPRSVT